MNPWKSIALPALLCGTLASCDDGHYQQVAVDYLANYHSAPAEGIVAVTLADATGSSHKLIDHKKVSALSRALSDAGRRLNHSENLTALRREPMGLLSLDFSDGRTVITMPVFGYPERGLAEIMVPNDSTVRSAPALGSRDYQSFLAADGITILQGAFGL